MSAVSERVVSSEGRGLGVLRGVSVLCERVHRPSSQDLSPACQVLCVKQSSPETPEVHIPRLFLSLEILRLSHLLASGRLLFNLLSRKSAWGSSPL